MNKINPKTNVSSAFFHNVIGVLGIIALALSSISAVFFSYPHFYTLFCFGFWFLFDYIDYKLRKRSILTYFSNRNHQKALFLFLMVNFIASFFVDYILGVQLAGMWKWPDYGVWEYIRMYTLMVVAYGLGIYEVYSVFRYIISSTFKEQHLYHLHLNHNKYAVLFRVTYYLGIIFTVLPVISFLLIGDQWIEYVMIFPFLGIWLLMDTLTVYFKGKPILIDVLEGKKNMWFSIIATVLFSVFVMEFANTFAFEWSYERLPVTDFKITRIPFIVTIGWIPLVLFCISIITMVKSYNTYEEKKSFNHDSTK